jgi:Tol biopolymer transport system component/mono/diheme cytochrome c family protein
MVRNRLPLLTLIAGFVIIAVVLAWLVVSNATSTTMAFEQTRRVGDLEFTLQVSQQTMGEALYMVSVRTANGQPVELERLQLEFLMTEMEMGKILVDADQVVPGQYQARGLFFNMAGLWQIDVLARTMAGNDQVVRFELPVGAPGEFAGPVNPLRSDAQTILAGQRLYLANCAACHGQRGRGDGPLAAGASPPPSDFTLQMLPGRHSDGQIFMWIRDGYSSNLASAWRDRLTDEQIWQVVTFLKTFGRAPGSPAPYPPPTDDEPLPTADALPSAVPSDPLTTGPAAVPTVSEPLPPSVFSRSGNIWRSNGSELTQLTNFGPESYAQYPIFSPDGSRVAFIVINQPPITAAAPLPVGALYVMNADGSNLRAVLQPKQGLLGLTAWSGDGRSLYVSANGVRSTDGGRDLAILLVNIDTGAFQALLEDAMDPAISANGQQLAYLLLSRDGYTQSIYVANSDGTNPRKVYDSPDFQGFYAPRFTPDGTRLIVAAIGGPLGPQGSAGSVALHGLPWDLWQINLDGTGLRRLTEIFEDLPLVSFSPDGSELLMMGSGGIYRLKPDGSELRRIDPLGDHGGIDWAKN